MLFIYDALHHMQGRETDGERPYFSCRYVKANGHVAEIGSAMLLRLEKAQNAIIIRTPGGARTLKIFAIVAYNGEEVFL